VVAFKAGKPANKFGTWSSETPATELTSKIVGVLREQQVKTFMEKL